MAERTSLLSYMIYVAWDTSVINPLVVHWLWSSRGLLSPYNFTEEPFLGSGAYDFAGSGVVHMCGGIAGIVAAWKVGPRTGRFRPDGTVKDMPGHSLVLCTLGAFILWFGWFGFNCGSTLTLRGGAGWVASHVAITTTLSASMATVSASIFSKVCFHYYDLSMVINCLLGGLVAITSGCASVEYEGAIVIGALTPFFYYGQTARHSPARICHTRTFPDNDNVFMFA